LDGDWWSARQGVSLLWAAGFEEFTTLDSGGYVEKAVGLANDAGRSGRLGALRERMQGHLLESAVCETVEFARNMDALYVRFVGPG